MLRTPVWERGTRGPELISREGVQRVEMLRKGINEVGCDVNELGGERQRLSRSHVFPAPRLSVGP